MFDPILPCLDNVSDRRVSHFVEIRAKGWGAYSGDWGEVDKAQNEDRVPTDFS